MIADQRLTDYIFSLETGQGELCDRIEQEALAARIPILRRETAALLKTLVAATAPKAILEIGTAVGYSALLMAQVMPKDAAITTVEKYEKRIPLAREHFRLAGEEERITLLEGDAGEIIKDLPERAFDFVFMDAAKGQYLGWLPGILRVMKPGAILVSDNVLQDGDVIQSRFAVERRDRTIHTRMREYLWELKHREELQTSVLTVGDGVALSVLKIGNDNLR